MNEYKSDYHPKFCKEFKKFINRNKCPTLESDFKLFKKNLKDDISRNKLLPSKYHKISGLDSRVNQPAFIFKDFRCEGINKGKKSGFRITFLIINREYFYFTEIYHKNQKDVEDKERINALFR